MGKKNAPRAYGGARRPTSKRDGSAAGARRERDGSAGGILGSQAGQYQKTTAQREQQLEDLTRPGPEARRIFYFFWKSVENRFRQVPQVDLDLQNSKKIAKTPQNSKNI